MATTIICRLEIRNDVVANEYSSEDRTPAIRLIELEEKRKIAATSTPQIETMQEML
jgi:hypothetical protein